MEKFGIMELARRAGVGLNTAYRWVWLRKIPADQKNGRWEINQADAEKFLKEREARLGGGK